MAAFTYVVLRCGLLIIISNKMNGDGGCGCGYNEANEYGNSKIWSEKVRCSSKMKPRLRAERVVLSEELRILLSSCFLSPMSTNSVLKELRVRV